jgi:hypothetical protein
MNKLESLENDAPPGHCYFTEAGKLKKQTMAIQGLSAELFIPHSEISVSLKRSEKAGLYNAEVRNVHRLALMEFIRYGLKYMCSRPGPGAMVTGLGTAPSHHCYRKFFQA